jgi:glycosyltransferase involved in cell wall biosynthesis
MSLDLSVIVPLYNEEESVPHLWAALCRALAPLGRRSEVVLVDDGSRDGTFAAALALPRGGTPRLRLVKFRRNYGQTAAMAAGIEHARGRVLITMDGDLQNDPADIPRFLEKIDEGFDLVVGWRRDRKDHWSRVLPSKVANWLIGKITGVPIKDNGCSLKAFRGELIKAIPLYSEMHRFIPAMTTLAGARIAEIEVRHHPRRFGASKYGFSRIYKVFADMLAIRTIIAFARRPTVWLGSGALLAALLSLVALAVSLLLIDPGATRPSAVFQGLAILWGALAIFLVALGFLTHLVHAAGADRLQHFAMLAARPGRSTQHLAHGPAE